MLSPLPGGVSGRALLVKCDLDPVSGDVTLRGTILQPRDYKGRPTAIKCVLGDDNTKSVETRLAPLLNELRKLGLDLRDSMDDPRESDEWLRTGLESLERKRPIFKFNTWTASNGVVLHAWNGCPQEEEI